MINSMSVEQLNERISVLEQCVNKAPEWFLPASEKAEIAQKIGKLKASVAKISREPLFVGLLGGTGVGKSTIMNALAGENISSTDHRRPHTENILIYHHKDRSIPPDIVSSDLPIKVYTHEANAIKSLVLCDLPDFDSIKTEHRSSVITFLEKLDILVWVVSPEKYADDSFYSFISDAMAVKHPKNFIFVFNKIDLIMHHNKPSGEINIVSDIAVSMSNYLNRVGINNPTIFYISAKEALSNNVNNVFNQWELFKNAIYREWSTKEIKAIKGANIEQEIEDILDRINTLKAKGKEIAHIFHLHIFGLQETKLLLRNRVKNIARKWAAILLENNIENLIKDRKVLFGPAALIYTLLTKTKTEKTGIVEKKENYLPEEIKGLFEQIENKLSSISISTELPDYLKAELNNSWNKENLWIRFLKRFEDYSNNLNQSSTYLSQKSYFFFRLSQFVTYATLLIIFFMSMGRIWTIKNVTFYHLITTAFFGCFERLFSMDGLGAILSLGILEILSGYYFVLKFRKSLHRLRQKFIETVEHEIADIWDGVVQDIEAFLKSREKEISTWIS